MGHPRQGRTGRRPPRLGDLDAVGARDDLAIAAAPFSTVSVPAIIDSSLPCMAASLSSTLPSAFHVQAIQSAASRSALATPGLECSHSCACCSNSTASGRSPAMTSSRQVRAKFAIASTRCCSCFHFCDGLPLVVMLVSLIPKVRPVCAALALPRKPEPCRRRRFVDD